MLSEKVKLSVGVVGIGFAGSYNAQRVFNDLNIPAFVINSSTKDLSDGVIDANIPSFIIGQDGRGAGNDRMKAKEAFKFNGRKLLEDNPVFVKLASESDILFVVFSSSGGTGSGSGPDFVKVCRKIYPQKQIIPIVIAPKHTDSSLAQYNNLECINELDVLEGPYIIADLDRYATDNDDIAYEKISEWVVETVRKIGGMEMNMTQSGMMDENDLQNVISAKGYLTQYTINVSAKSLEREDIQDILIKRINESPAMMIQKDRHVAWGGLIVNLPQDINDPIRSGDLSKLLAVIGEPKHVYKNYSVSNSTNGTVTIILSGLSLPYNRLSECTAKIEEYMKATKDSQRNISLANDISKLSGSDISFGGFTSANKPVQSDASQALDDFFD